jgi:hypothetical protein
MTDSPIGNLAPFDGGDSITVNYSIAISHGHPGTISGKIDVPGNPRFGLKNMKKRFMLTLEDGTKVDIVVIGPNGEFGSGPTGVQSGSD